MLFVRRSCRGDGPLSSVLVTDSRFLASAAFAVWYSSEYRLILSAKKIARSRFLIMKSVAVNHLCSKHSSTAGRFLKRWKSFFSVSDSTKAKCATHKGVRLKMNMKNLEASGVTSR